MDQVGDVAGDVGQFHFRAGEKVPASGIWRNEAGHEAALKRGDRFPPARGRWAPVRLTRSVKVRRRPDPGPAGSKADSDCVV